MKILVLDNYDSFTYNLVHIIREYGYGAQLDVIRNDKITVAEVEKYDKILLSPGPGIPVEAGILMDLIKTYAPTKSIMGVCLGHQAICESFGATLTNMKHVLHGVGMKTTILDQEDYFLKGLPKEFITGRYHSWVAEKDTVKGDVEITAISEDDYVMAVKHKTYDVRGVQFHPESILTDGGKRIVLNWLEH